MTHPPFFWPPSRKRVANWQSPNLAAFLEPSWAHQPDKLERRSPLTPLRVTIAITTSSLRFEQSANAQTLSHG